MAYVAITALDPVMGKIARGLIVVLRAPLKTMVALTIKSNPTSWTLNQVF